MYFRSFFKPLAPGLLMVFAGLLISSCEQVSPPVPSGKFFRVAYINVMEADDADHQDDILDGILAANAAEPYLSNGDQLEILYHRQDASPQDLTRSIFAYIENEGISAILLGSDSKVVLDIKQEVNAFGVPTLAVVATHPDITAGVRFISQLSFDDERQGQAAALFVRDELLIRRAAVFFDEKDPYSSYLGQTFRTQFEKSGGTINEFGLVAQLNQTTLKSLREQGTELIYLPLSANQVLETRAKMKAINWKPVLMGSDGFLAELKRNFPNRVYELSGMYVTDLFTDTKEFVSVARYVKRVLGQFDEMFDSETSSKTALGVEAYRVIHGAINRCPDRHNFDCINGAIRSGQAHRGIISRFTIKANGKAERPIYINIIKNNELNMVVKVN